MDALAALIFIATIVEGLNEYLFSGVGKLQPYLKYLGLVLGVLAAVGFNLDLFGLFKVAEPYPLAGVILTGLVIGRGSNYLNDVIDGIRRVGAPKAA